MKPIETKLSWHGRKATEAVRAEGGKAVEEGLEFLLDESNKTVPHNEGMLQQSGDTSFDPLKNQGTVFYDTPYARRLHEHPEFRFQKGRRGKWLELTFEDNKTKILKYIQAAIQRALKGR